MKKPISTSQTGTNIQEVIRVLEESPRRLEGLSKGLSDLQLHEPLGSGERSFTEALAHLIHTKALSSEAIYLALLADEPLPVDIHAERDLQDLEIKLNRKFSNRG